MSNKVEKSFEERLHSLKVGCIIFGIGESIALINSLICLSLGKGFLPIIIEIVMFGILYFMYKYTSEKKLLGPILEYIFGGLMLVQGIIYCRSIAGILIGIILIILSISILSEATYFKKFIEQNNNY